MHSLATTAGPSTEDGASAPPARAMPRRARSNRARRGQRAKRRGTWERFGASTSWGRGTGSRRSGSPTSMIRPGTAGVRSYRAGIRRGAVSVEMGRSCTSCSSTWARSPPASRPSWPRSASLPAALIRRRSTKPASTAALDGPGGSGVRGIGLNRTGFCGGSGVPGVSRGQLA